MPDAWSMWGTCECPQGDAIPFLGGKYTVNNSLLKRRSGGNGGSQKGMFLMVERFKSEEEGPLGVLPGDRPVVSNLSRTIIDKKIKQKKNIPNSRKRKYAYHTDFFKPRRETAVQRPCMRSNLIFDVLGGLPAKEES